MDLKCLRYTEVSVAAVCIVVHSYVFWSCQKLFDRVFTMRRAESVSEVIVITKVLDYA